MTSADNKPAVDIDFSNTLPLAIVEIDSHMWLVCTVCTNIKEAKLGRLIRTNTEVIANGRLLNLAIEHVLVNHM